MDHATTGPVSARLGTQALRAISTSQVRMLHVRPSVTAVGMESVTTPRPLSQQNACVLTASQAVTAHLSLLPSTVPTSVPVEGGAPSATLPCAAVTPGGVARGAPSHCARSQPAEPCVATTACVRWDSVALACTARAMTAGKASRATQARVQTRAPATGSVRPTDHACVSLGTWETTAHKSNQAQPRNQ